MTGQAIIKEIRSLANPEIAAHSQRFFKTGKGEYGEGDQFHGIRVPVLRGLVKKHKNQVTVATAKEILPSPFHEERLFALLLMVALYQSGDAQQQAAIYGCYLENTQYINNWDLVDSSAHYIIGAHLQSRDKKILYSLARSSSLWERRIAMMSTFCFIKNNKFDDTLGLATLLLNDPEDLLHKAVGWMLREIGKRDQEAEERFLKHHYTTMPRTMLRYAIEKFPQSKRKKYLQGDI